MNDFHHDDQWQRQQRDEFLVPFYQRRYSGFVLFDAGRFAKMQQQAGCDTLVWRADLTPTAIEEKIVRPPLMRGPYTAICLETESCTEPGHISRGWMWYSTADVLLYGMLGVDDTLDCLWIDFPKLHRWFWPREKRFPLHVMPTENKTASRVVPIDDIAAAVPMHRFTMARGGAALAGVAT
jgi:hypothetical protein